MKISKSTKKLIEQGVVIPTEKYREQIEKEHEKILDIKHDNAHTYYEAQDYRPEFYGKKLHADGDWVCIKIPPPTEIKVPKWSMWFAKQNKDVYNRYQVTIITPEGALGVVPGEYFILNRMTTLLELVGMELEMHFLDENSGIDEDKLFYIMNRGISKEDAIIMLLKNLKTQNLCYFTVKEKYADELTATFG